MSKAFMVALAAVLTIAMTVAYGAAQDQGFFLYLPLAEKGAADNTDQRLGSLETQVGILTANLRTIWPNITTPWPTPAAPGGASATATAVAALTPVPSAGYSRSNPAPAGAPLEITLQKSYPSQSSFRLKITLLEMIRGQEAWSLIQAALSLNKPPDAGYEYILAKVRYEYLQGPNLDAAHRIAESDFDAVSSSGRVYTDPNTYLPPKPRLSETELYPGAAHEGWIIFMVALDDSTPLMAFGRNSAGGGGAWFRLYQ